MAYSESQIKQWIKDRKEEQKNFSPETDRYQVLQQEIDDLNKELENNNQ